MTYECVFAVFTKSEKAMQPGATENTGSGHACLVTMLGLLSGLQ